MEGDVCPLSTVPQDQHGQISTDAKCKPHIELLSAADVAREYGKPESWVVANYRVKVWKNNTPEGKGSPVGEMRPGSRAVILEEGSQDFKVKSPLDGSVGWVNKIQVARTLSQNVETRRPCR
jgi:hypothetical protein